MSEGCKSCELRPACRWWAETFDNPGKVVGLMLAISICEKAGTTDGMVDGIPVLDLIEAGMRLDIISPPPGSIFFDAIGLRLSDVETFDTDAATLN